MSEEREIVLFRIDRKVGLLMLGALAVTVGGFALAETLTLTTSYPVPSGIYNQLITTGNSGTVPANTTLNKSAGNTILVPPTNAGGMVGIGTTSPATTLDVNGPIRPGSATTGHPCTPEGSLAYDGVAHSSVYCNKSLVWSTSGSIFSQPTLFDASATSDKIVTTPTTYSLCVLTAAGESSGCGRCAVAANGNGTWSLNQASCGNNTFEWCSMACW